MGSEAGEIRLAYYCAELLAETSREDVCYDAIQSHLMLLNFETPAAN